MPDAADTTTPAATEGTGKTTGASDGATTQVAAGNEAPTAAPVFTAEQIAHIGKLLEEERAKERDAARKAQERAQAKEQERVQTEQGQFKELAEQREKRISELEAENARVAREAMIARVQARHKLPDEIAARLVGATEAELDADAKKLSAMLVPPQAPDTESGAGNKPNGAPRAQTPPAPPPNNGERQPAFSWQTPGDVAW